MPEYSLENTLREGEAPADKVLASVPLDEAEFGLVGKLTAILALVDEAMDGQATIIDPEAGRDLRQDTRSNDRITAWSRMVRGVLSENEHKGVLDLANFARRIFDDRHVFIHGIVIDDANAPFDRRIFDPNVFDTGDCFVRRLKDGKEINVELLSELVRRAAELLLGIRAISEKLLRSEDQSPAAHGG